MKLQEIIIILCRPSDPGNIGAVCRAMMNMGLSRLRITGLSREDLAPFEGEIRSRAVHAAAVWEQAQFFGSLKAAAADCAVLAGTTRRRGRRRKNITMDCRELSLWLRDRPGKAALAFGNERSGLDDSELALCNLASHIPVSGAFPSLNLSHAVQVYGYELFCALGPEAAAGTAEATGPAEAAGSEETTGPAEATGLPAAVKGAWEALDRDRADALAAAITGNLESLGFYRHPGREDQARFIRDFISRAALSRREGEYLGGIFAKAARLALRGGAGGEGGAKDPINPI
ncbi:MAG: RNA methyltransferase [Treponema sp.]|jgi:tRNA/rRNA methyltransferase/tRNA (cytidine32/uridine32-2'-O)-methyltransferase|nr:RNA methyltransferase [Treponema sp.]